MMPEIIITFLKKQTCASICCIAPVGPWCFTCFYAFDWENMLLCFKTSAATKHAQILNEDNRVAGTVLPDKLNKLAVQGVQFEGVVINQEDPASANASTFYYKQHPLAVAMPGQVWAVQLNSIKMTDSTLGFGKKTTWRRK